MQSQVAAIGLCRLQRRAEGRPPLQRRLAGAKIPYYSPQATLGQQASPLRLQLGQLAHLVLTASHRLVEPFPGIHQPRTAGLQRDGQHSLDGAPGLGHHVRSVEIQLIQCHPPDHDCLWRAGLHIGQKGRIEL